MSAEANSNLPTGRKLAYGLGELGSAMAGSTLIFFQLIFLTTVAGLDAGLAGTVLMVGKLWDAFNDPLIGWLSDRTRTRFGRRLPWMVLSTGPFAIFFFLNWTVPGFLQGSQMGLFAYYVAVSILFNVFYTGMALSHSSLTPALSSDYDERSRITSYRMGFSLGGSVGGLLVALVVFKLMAGASDGVRYAVMAGVIAVIGIGAMVLCVAGIWRIAIARDVVPVRDINVPRMPMRERARVLVTNKPFLIVCGIYLFSWMAMQFTASILPFYVRYWLGFSDTKFQVIALMVQGTALVLIPFWAWVCVRRGKKAVYFYGISVWLVAQIGLWFLPQHGGNWVMGLALLAGIGISVCYLVPNAMLPDVMELDELETGERREGIYYGFFVFLQKLALALGTFIVGQALSAAGYISSVSGGEEIVQPESALLAIRFAIAPLPAVVLVIGLLLAIAYPITKQKHAEILQRLAEKKAASA